MTPIPSKFFPPTVGDVIGSRTVLRETAPDHRGRRRFRCRCECGNEQTIPLHRLNAIRAGRAGTRCIKCAWRDRPPGVPPTRPTSKTRCEGVTATGAQCSLHGFANWDVSRGAEADRKALCGIHRNVYEKAGWTVAIHSRNDEEQP